MRSHQIYFPGSNWYGQEKGPEEWPKEEAQQQEKQQQEKQQEI